MTLVSIDRGDGEKITVTIQDALRLRDDALLYGDTFVKAHPTIPGVYQRIDPRTVQAATDIAEHRSMTIDEARDAIARQLP